MPRTPKPRTAPVTLVELILDLDERMSGGDALSAVELPGPDWIALVERADIERDLPLTRSPLMQVDAAVSRFDDLRRELARVVGWGSRNGAEDLLQVVLGFIMALDCERDQLARRAQLTCPHCGDLGHTGDECALAPSEEIEDDEPPENADAITPAPKPDHADESYCRSCRKWFPSGTHATHSKNVPGDPYRGPRA